MVELLPISKDQFVAIRLSGAATPEDYRGLGELLDKKLEKYKMIRVLLRLDGVSLWALRATWEGLRVGLAHRDRIEVLALVGEKKTEQMVAWAVELFTGTVVECFPEDGMDEAWHWLKADHSDKLRSYANRGAGSLHTLDNRDKKRH
jgi:hypothetical protein